MAERYTRIFSLKNDLYTENSPVVIAAGALLKDNQENKKVAQIKIKSITESLIKGVRIKIQPLDITEKPLGEPVIHQYLSLQAHCGEEFGQKNPAELPDNSTCSYKISNVEVIFENNYTWNSADAEWLPLEKRVSLEEILGDNMAAIYRSKCGNDCKYVAKKERDIWTCTCGAINSEKNGKCRACEKEYEVLQNELNLNNLQAEANKAEAKAQLSREEKRQATEKKQKTITKLIAAAVVLAVIVAVAAIVIPNLSKAKLYDVALEYVENQQYSEARTAFASLGNYKDSQDKLLYVAKEQERLYQEAISFVNENKIDEARESFLLLGDYEDCLAYVNELDEKEAAYQEALTLFEVEDYKAAIEAFDALGVYREAEGKKREAQEKLDAITFVIDGKDYIGTFMGETEFESWKIPYLDDAYAEKSKFFRIEDFNYKTIQETYPLTRGWTGETQYTAPIEEGTSYVVLLCDSDDNELAREFYYCTGEQIDGEVICREFFPTIHKVSIRDKEYDAVYGGWQYIGDWLKGYESRAFWRVEGAYEDFKDAKKTGNYLPYHNYMIMEEAMKTGYLYMIDYEDDKGSHHNEFHIAEPDFYFEGDISTFEVDVDY